MIPRSLLCWMSLLLVACAAADRGLRPRAPTERPAPDGVVWEQTSFSGRGGVSLYAQRWRPAADAAPRGVLVLHHGLADHSGRYAALAEELARGGYVVWGLDMRGHGRSAGSSVAADAIEDYLFDLDALLAQVRQRDAGPPVFLFGHSLGGLIATLYVIERQPALAGLITSAPGIAFDAPPVQAAVIRLVAALAPSAPILATPHGDFSASPAVIEDLNRDPLIYQGKGPARTARAAVDGVARVWAAAARLDVPLLALHGLADKVTAPSGSRDLVARAGAADKTLRLYPGLNHDLLHEPDGGGQRVAADLHAWLDAHTGGPATSFALTPTPAHLRGDASGRALALELDVRGESPRDGEKGLSAGLRVRLGFGGSTGLGYLAGVDLRGGALDGGFYEADAHLAGLALRGRAGALLSATAGLGVGGLRSASATHAPVELAAELPVGPARLLARAALGWRLGGPAYPDEAVAGVDELTASLGLRLGRDLRYWGSVTAGAGPFLAVTYRNLGGAELLGLSFGAQLWGGN